jgi:pimeloyl-ACP methyl ester carboxylesterase
MKNALAFGYVVMSLVGCVGADELPVSTGDADRGSTRYTVVRISTDARITQPLEKIDTVIQAGINPNNRFTMHRIHLRQGVVKGSIILVPSLVNNFAEYMIGEKHGPMDSLAASLARAHYDVYGFSPRTANLPPHACTTGGVDCAVMKNWDLATYVQDVEYIRTQVADHDKPVIGGLSLGGMVGVAAVNANPSGYSGLLLWEALLYSANPAVTTLSTQNCANLRSTTASGVYWEENLPLTLKQFAQTGEAATISFFGVPQPAISGTPDWIQLAADSTRTHYAFARFPRVFDFIMAFNSVESLPLIRDFQCSLAGDRTYTSNLRNFHAPILAIEGGQGFGNYMQDTIDLTRSTRVRVQADQVFGHLDAYLNSDYEKYTEARILDWLKTDVFRH